MFASPDQLLFELVYIGVKDKLGFPSNFWKNGNDHEGQSLKLKAYSKNYDFLI